MPFAEEELVKIVRCGAEGEGSRAYAGVQTWLWPRSVLEGLSREMSPVSCRIGIPLCVAKVKPCCVLEDRALWDNQRITYLMIDTVTGLAPGRRQSHVGPVVVWRASLQPFSCDDFWLVQNVLTRLLDKYADGAVQLSCDVTPKSLPELQAKESELRAVEPSRCAAVGRCEHMSGLATDTRIASRGK